MAGQVQPDFGRRGQGVLRCRSRGARGQSGTLYQYILPSPFVKGAAKESRGHRAAAGIAGADADNEGTGTHSHSSV